MILADKITTLRKKEGMTQEDLAQEIGVSRQSVSKWEASMSMPDLDKIMKLSRIFGVSTDFLLNDDLGMEEIIVDQKNEDIAKTIDLDLLNDYFDTYEKIAKYTPAGVGLAIISPIAYMAFEKVNENLGMFTFFAIIAFAVGLFVNSGFMASKYEFIEKESYNFSYGVEGVIEKNLNDYEPTLKRNVIISIVIFFLAPALYVLSEGFNISEDISTYVFLVLIALGAILMGYSFIRYSSYKDILKYRDPKIQKKEGSLGKASAILWVLTIGIYLGYSFITGNWHNSWVIFVISSFIQIAIAIFFDK